MKRKHKNTLGYWKLTPSNKWKWMKKIRIDISGEPESYSNKTIMQTTYQRNKYLGFTPSMIFETIHEVDQKKTLANGPKNKKTNDHVYDITSQRWCWEVYLSRKEGGRGLASIEERVDASIQRLEDYIEKHERGLITATGTQYWQHEGKQNDKN